MATAFDPRDNAIVNYDEPPIKPPPVLSVGPLAWMRENLFKSTFDTVLTLVSAVVIVGGLISMFNWAVGAANWFVITNNFRLFMAGTFPLESMWRLEWATRLCAFVIGFTLLAYTRINRGLLIFIAAVLALLFVVPPIVQATVPPVTAYFTAGSKPVVSGTITEQPQDQVTFIARAGETVTVQLAGSRSDQQLAALPGFADRATNALFNAADNRLADQQALAQMQHDLDHGLLTDAQRADLTQQVSSTTIPDPVTDTYAINQSPVTVQIVDGANPASVIVSGTLTTDSPPLTAQLPADGWYIFSKSSDGTAVLATTGIYPLRERNLTRDLPSGGSERYTEYVRMTDGFTTGAPVPENSSGKGLPEVIITDNQYQGARPVSDYLRIFVAPFFRDLSFPLLQLVFAGVLGFGAASGLMRVLPAASGERGDRRKRVRGWVTWLWVLFLMALAVLAYGVQGLTPLGLGLLLSRFVWVGWMYFAGMNLDRTWGRPLLALVTVLGLVQSVLAEHPTDKLGDPAALIGAVIGIGVWLGIGWYAARMGRGQRSRWNDSQRLRALIGSAVLWLILFIVPPLLLAGSGTILPLTDTRRWGGFMLTFLLTIVAILASFPLGVLLALGRRSALPVVHWTSVVYIELVRGVPLITVLFMAQLLVPLVNPALANVDNVFRAMVGLTLFSAAYLAENVRGGLQSIPPGQEEAAKALGLNSYQITLLIMLPQALRAVIPALVGQAIALFKDTSLVALVGLIDLTGMAKSVIAQPEYVGLQNEVYFFISIIYFIFSYLMAWISRRIEASGSGAARRV